MDCWEALKAVISMIVFGTLRPPPKRVLQRPGAGGPGTGLGTENIKVACGEGATNGICALGNAFVYEQGAYPKLKKCVGYCSDSDPSSHVHGADLLGGQ